MVELVKPHQKPPPRPKHTAAETLDRWKQLTPAPDLTDAVIRSFSTAIAAGNTLMQYCDGGHNKDDQLLRAEQGRLATVTVDGTVYRAPSRTSIEHWLTDGERDRGRGENSLPAQLLEAFLHARIRSAHAAYDEILWLEQRMAMPKYRANPHYGQPDQPRNLENELYLEAGSATKLIQSKQWRLERLLPEMFGASMTVNQNVSGKIEMVAAAPGWVQKMIADKASTAIDVTPEGEKD